MKYLQVLLIYPLIKPCFNLDYFILKIILCILVDKIYCLTPKNGKKYFC